jgi:DNA-binding SARP family transcriptional activator
MLDNEPTFPARSSLEMHLLGPFRLIVDGQALDERRFTRRKPKLLIKLLALQPHHQLHREQAMELLWPDSDPESAGNSLHKAIHMARRALEPDLQSAADSHFIITQGQQISLRAPGKTWIDIEAFEGAAADAMKGANIGSFETALTLYGGDLLPEDLYEDWAALRREQLRTTYQELLAKLAGLHEALGDYERSVDSLKKLALCDPTNEQVQRKLMSAYASLGNRPQALRQFERCRTSLLRDLDVAPELATLKLHEQILAGEIHPQPAEPVKSIGRSRVIRSLATLPLAHARAEPNIEYLSDGIVESLINSLSQLSQLRVIARTTVFRYKGIDIDPRKVGYDLGVDAVLTGAVMQRGQTLIIQVDLVDVATGSQVWGEQYKYPCVDILSIIHSVQDKIARQISETLRLKLTGEEKKLLTKRYTTSSEAYQAYLKGRYYWNKRIEAGFKRAIEYFKQAIDKDPNYAPAYAGLADSYALLSWYSVEPAKNSFPQAKAAALKALELDETLAEAHTSLAFIKQSFEWDFAGATGEYQRAIALNPGYATARQWYGISLSAMGRHQEAIAKIELAQELDPLSLVINRDGGWVCYWARQYDRAIEHYRKTFDLEPHFYIAHYFLGEVYEQKGDYQKAIAEFRQTKSHPEWSVKVWTLLAHARASGLAGKRSAAEEKMAELQSLSKRHYVSPYLIAVIYSSFSEKDNAFEWLEKAFAERDPYLIYLKVEPALDYLRTDLRFNDLMRRVGLPVSDTLGKL